MATAKKVGEKEGKIAIIKTGGKQYPVSVGKVINVEKIADNLEVGAKITFDTVLLVIDGEKVEVGTPTVKATVMAELVENGRGEKIRVGHFMAKSNRNKIYGHRQPFSKVRITEIK